MAAAAVVFVLGVEVERAVCSRPDSSLMNRGRGEGGVRMRAGVDE